MKGGMIVKRTNSGDQDFRSLVSLLDQELAIRDGNDHSFYAQYNKIDQLQNTVVCYVEERAIGCGAFKKHATNSVEIKRMFVVSELRGQGFAQVILKELESWAGELGFEECILETGKKQPEAIRLYQKAGYILIPNYGQYEGVENSVCMKRKI